MFHTKEQDKNPKEELSEGEISNLPNRMFKVMIIMMLKELWRRLDEQSEKLKVFKQRENIKKNQAELKNTIPKMKNTLEGISSRFNDTEEWINQLEDRVVEIIEVVEITEQKKINEQKEMRTVYENCRQHQEY